MTESPITVIGYGSLLSEVSARETIPTLTGFDLVEVSGFKRVFNKVGIVFFERFGAVESDLRIASCATRAAPGVSMICSKFECSSADFMAIYEREHRFRWISVPFVSRSGEAGLARMCTEYNDQDYFLNKCVTEEEYMRRVGRFYRGKIWRSDILPFPTYLQHCIRSAESQGDAVLSNFLDTTFIADGITSIRDYTRAHPDWNQTAKETYSYDD